MRRRVYYGQKVGMGLRPGVVPAQYSAWVLTGARRDRQEAVAHRITLLYAGCLGDISPSWMVYLGPAWVAFSLPYIMSYLRYICRKIERLIMLKHDQGNYLTCTNASLIASLLTTPTKYEHHCSSC